MPCVSDNFFYLGGNDLLGGVFGQHIGDKVEFSLIFHYFCGMGNGMNGMGKILIGLGLLLIVSCAVVLLLGKFPVFKSLLGDIVLKRENFTCYYHLGTSILISIVLTLFLYLWRKFGG